MMNLNVAVQPLVALSTSEIAGYEALARPDGAEVAPATLFTAAVAGGWIADLELGLAKRAFAASTSLLTRGQRLFLNVHPAALDTPGFAKRLLRDCFCMSRIVVEVTEQGPIAKPEVALANIEELRGAGALFALDDFGSGYAHMRWLHDIRPQFIKIAQSIATDFEQAPWRRSVVRNVQSFAKEVGCAVIAEGIETAETAEAARAMGVEYGQGYFFGRPTISEYSSSCGTSPSRGRSSTSITSSTSPR